MLLSLNQLPKLLLLSVLGWSAAAADALAKSPVSEPDVGNEQSSPAVQFLIERHGQALVTVSYAMSVEYQGEQQRVQGEVDGLVIDPAGVVLVSRDAVNPTDQMRRMFASFAGSEGFAPPTMRSSEFKIRRPGNDEPIAATLINQDRDLRIAWLKIDQPGDDPLPAVDLSTARAPAVGDYAFALNRSTELYGYVPFVIPTMIWGKVDVPYPALLTDPSSRYLFGPDGAFLGFVNPEFGSADGMGFGNFKAFGVVIPGPRVAQLTQTVLAALDEADNAAASR